MSKLSQTIASLGKYLLDNSTHAILGALVFALFPYTKWLAVAVMALLTLRKGWREGGYLLLIVSLAYFGMLSLQIPYGIAMIKALSSFLPCYLAANVLRTYVSWRAVAGMCLLIIFAFVSFIQLVTPEFIVLQFKLFKAILVELNNNGPLIDWIEEGGYRQMDVANYLLGTQALGMILSAILSLMFARWVQSLMFYKGAFKQEMQAFRAEKPELFMLGAISFAAYFGVDIAINLLPAILLYFILAGLSLGYSAFARKKPLGTFLVLITPMVLLPYIMLPIYLLFGSLDSVFNLRLYLHGQADK
jgi:hypothetical protein